MSSKDSISVLAALVTLIHPDMPPEQAVEAARTSLARVYETMGMSDRPRVEATELRRRIVAFLRLSEPVAPTTREVLRKVSGDRGRVHEALKALIKEGALVVVRDGRFVGIRLAPVVVPDVK